jgi:hypothetical protein
MPTKAGSDGDGKDEATKTDVGIDGREPPQEGSVFQRELLESLEGNAFPVLNHLMTLRALILHEILAGSRRGTADRTAMLVEELRRVEKEYGSPTHFTPFYVGTTLALYFLRDGANAEGADLALEARRQLIRSQHTYSSRSAYYEMIANLYYLDDDFNDGCIQVRHAVQMMGRDLTSMLLARLSPPREVVPAGQRRFGEPNYAWVRGAPN